MTFLQLVQRLRSECIASGSGPSTTVGQSGESGRLVNWINDAWLLLQEEHPDFDWMRKEVTFTTTNNQSKYTLADIAITDHGKWKMDSFRCYQTSVGYGSELFLSPIRYDAWRDEYQYNARRTTTSRPIAIAQAPDLSLCLGPTPNADGFTVVGEYWKAPAYMAVDADEPDMPARYHLAIVYRAMMDYGSYSAAPEVYNRGETKYNEMLRRIEADQLPGVSLGGSLA